MNRYVITRAAPRGIDVAVAALLDGAGKPIELIAEPCGANGPCGANEPCGAADGLGKNAANGAGFVDAGGMAQGGSSDAANGAGLGNAGGMAAQGISPDADARLGDIRVGRVEHIVRNINAAFVRIAPGQTAYLPLEDMKSPIFTRRQSEKKDVSEGDELLVQVKREALKTKEPAVTTNLNFAGTLAAVTTGNRKVGVSSKLSKEQREHYRELVRGEFGSDFPYGVVIRTNAAAHPDGEVCSQIKSLARAAGECERRAAHQVAGTLLYREPPAMIRRVDDFRDGEPLEVVTDDPVSFSMLGGDPDKKDARLPGRDGISLRFYDDPLISLSALYGLESAIERALQKRVWLPSGAYIVIEPTEALVAVDVNTGKSMRGAGEMEHFLSVNLEAASEIARQIRLRNLSGMILVDFVRMDGKGSREANGKLLSAFSAALKKDPVPATMEGMTRLGLVEVTRKKVRRPLAEAFFNRETRG